MLTNIHQIIQCLERIAPLHYQEKYDNAGLIVGNRWATCKRVLLCLDSTEAVVDEAIERGCSLIIAHHPIVFAGLKKITGNNYIERVIIKAIKHDIAIYAAHTNLDNVQEGVNKQICDKLGLQHCSILSPKKNTMSNEVIGAGMIGVLPQQMPTMQFLKRLKNTMQAGCVRYTRPIAPNVKTIAVCGGSGSFLLPQAIAQKADVFVTADYKYHQFFDADGRIVIADIGHYESEQYTMALFRDILTKNFNTFEVVLTTVNTNPIKYL